MPLMLRLLRALCGAAVIKNLSFTIFNYNSVADAWSEASRTTLFADEIDA